MIEIACAITSIGVGHLSYARNLRRIAEDSPAILPPTPIAPGLIFQIVPEHTEAHIASFLGGS